MKKISILVLFIVGMMGTLLFGGTYKNTQVGAAPIPCSGKAFMVRSTNGVNGEEYSQLYEFINSGGTVSLSAYHNTPTGLTLGGQSINDEAVFPTGFILNALAYNPVDGYMYAVRIATSAQPTNTLYRIHNDGSLESVGTITLSPDSNLRAASFAPDGTYYAMGSIGGQTVLYTVTGAATNSLSQSSVVLSQFIQHGDLAYDFTSSTLYGIDNTTLELFTIVPATGVTTRVSASVPAGPGVTFSVNGVGSLFLTSTGQLRGYINNDGAGGGILIDIDKTTNQLTYIMSGPSTANSDGASCVPVPNTIDTVKSLSSMTAQNATTFDVNYSVVVKNTQPSTANPNVQLVDNLAQTFASGSPTIAITNLSTTSGNCTVNTSYNGTSDITLLTGSDTMNGDESCTLTLSVRLTYASAAAVPTAPQLNTVLASTASTGPNTGHTYSGSTTSEPFNVLAVDSSTDAVNAPATSNGDVPSPTPVSLSYAAMDVVKSVGSVTNVDATTFRIPYTIVVGNTGATTLPNVQVSDNLSQTFSAGSPEITVVDKSVTNGSCTINLGFNGTAQYGLLTGADSLANGQTCTLTLTVQVHYSDSSAVPQSDQNNTAYASSLATGPNPGYTYPQGGPTQPVGALAFDTSANASSLPVSAHSDAAAPTPVRFALAQTGISMFTLLGGIITAIAAGVLMYSQAKIRHYIARI